MGKAGRERGRERMVGDKAAWKRRYAKCTETHEKQAVNGKAHVKSERERPRRGAPGPVVNWFSLTADELFMADTSGAVRYSEALCAKR